MDLLESMNTRLQNAGIADPLREKWQALLGNLRSFRSAAVAYSGGVDSGFLAYVTFLALGDRMVALTINSSLEPPNMLSRAAQFATNNGFRHVIMNLEALQNPELRANPVNRCYLCKTAILNAIWKYARQNDFQVVLEGQNADDLQDYRPGRKAVEETGAVSPLAGCGLTKAEIRWLARALGLSIWDQPSSPCLASRFPYGTPITKEGLNRVALAEAFLHDKGFKTVRVRYHNELARIEIDPDQIQQLIDWRAELVKYFKQIGFLYVALDLQGYRLGSMNEGLSA
jgi:uncharacterized protein